jgi:branched-chain amino acid transport system substrate-binding protein
MSRRRRARVARVATAITLAFLSLTLLAPAHASGVANRAASKPPIYIGQITALSGAFAAGPGVFWKAGPKLAARQINAHGGVNGRPLKLVLVDDRSTPAGAIAAFGRLVKAGHVTAIIAPNSSLEIQAMTPSIERAHIPVIIGGQAPITTHEGDPWVFRTRPNALIEERVLSTFAVSTLHLARIALLHATDTGGMGFEATLLTDLKALGVVPLTDQSYPVGSSDLTAQVLAIKKSGATALLSGTSNASDCVLLVRQMHQVGLHLTLLGTPALASGETLRGAGALLYGTYAVNEYVAGQSPEAAAFDRYSRAVLHLPGDFASAYGYDGLQILARVMRKVGTAPGAIRRGILSIRGYHGVQGTYNFDRNGDGLHQDTVVQNVKGRLRVEKVVTF